MRERQRDDEARALAESLAFGADLAVMQLDDVPGDGQPESEAAAFRRPFRLAQTLEDMRQERGLDPLALIGDGDAHFRVDAIELEVDLPAFRRELDRVRE